MPHHISLYFTPYCGTCESAMDFLQDHGIRYQSMDVLAHPDYMTNLMQHHQGVHGTPVLVIDDQEIHQGFDPREWSRALGIH